MQPKGCFFVGGMGVERTRWIRDGIEHTEYKYMRDYPSACEASENERNRESRPLRL